MKKLLIAPNGFKECGDATKISKLFYHQFLELKNYEVVVKPISDGGDSFLEVCKKNYQLNALKYNIKTPYDDSIFSCEAGLDQSSQILYIEAANILGLKVIPEQFRMPMIISSRGMGNLISEITEDVADQKINVKKLIIGIGGTGTNDLGLGMCTVFGLRLVDVFNKELECVPEKFHRVKKIIWEKPNLPFEIEIIPDVTNPLLGKNGATRVYGPQKGLKGGEIEVLDLGFTKVIHTLEFQGVVKKEETLLGAGGGLAAGFQIFFDAKIKSSKDFIINDLGIGKLKNDVDFVITGEGIFNSQSLMGKATGVLIDEFKDAVKKIFLVCGKIDAFVKSNLPQNVIPIELIKYFQSKEESIKNFKKGIELASHDIINIINT
jgi:glycerate 2-kinase